jgi:hypothetical protein
VRASTASLIGMASENDNHPRHRLPRPNSFVLEMGAGEDGVSGAPGLVLRMEGLGQLRTNPGNHQISASCKNNYRLRIRGNHRGSALTFAFGPRRRRRLTARVITILSPAELYALRVLAQLIFPTALRPGAFALHPWPSRDGSGGRPRRWETQAEPVGKLGDGKGIDRQIDSFASFRYPLFHLLPEIRESRP